MLKIIAPLALALTFLLSGCEFDSAPPAQPSDLVIFEDGSARSEDGRTYPEGSFAWDCETMGNKVCGPATPALAPAPAPAPAPEPAPAPPAPAPAPEPLPMDIVVYEDGSAREWDGTTHPAGTFDYASVPEASRYSPCP